MWLERYLSIKAFSAVHHSHTGHHTRVSGRASEFSFESICHMCHFSVCQPGALEPFPCPVPWAASTVWGAGLWVEHCGVWRPDWYIKREGVEWEIWVSLSCPGKLSGDKLCVLTFSKGHAQGCPVIPDKLSELSAPDWPHNLWCNNDCSCGCSLWSWGPLLLRVTGRCGLTSNMPNEVCVGRMSSMLLPWWLLSPSDDPCDSHSDMSPREPGRHCHLHPVLITHHKTICGNMDSHNSDGQ